MKEHIIIEKVANGLRRMDIVPDYLIFIRPDDWTFDRDMICGIPVLYTANIDFRPYSDEQCPFLPAWKDQRFEQIDFNDFARGYYEG